MKRKCIVVGLSACTEGVTCVLKPVGETSSRAFEMFVPDADMAAFEPLTIGKELVCDVTAAVAPIALAA